MGTEHTIRAFDAELRDLNACIAEIGSLAVRQIADAIDALEGSDIDLAQRVVAAAGELDRLQREIEEKAVVIIARRQPFAVDLREIIGAMRISSDIEQIGDLAENVSREVVASAELIHVNHEVMLQMRHMSDLVLDQLRRVLDSYRNHDVDAAMAVWRKDEQVDALNNSLFRELLTYMMENPRNITPCTHLLFCAKNIERMGDHATNIAETVYYIVRGRLIAEERPKADVTSEQLVTMPA